MFAAVILLDISICVQFIPGKMNVIADNLSRTGQILPTEWSLHQAIVNHVFNDWGHPSADLFTTRTRYNTKCLNFVSATPDARAFDTAAMAIDWEGMSANAFPPQQILFQVLNKSGQLQ